MRLRKYIGFTIETYASIKQKGLKDDFRKNVYVRVRIFLFDIKITIDTKRF